MIVVKGETAMGAAAAAPQTTHENKRTLVGSSAAMLSVWEAIGRPEAARILGIARTQLDTELEEHGLGMSPRRRADYA